MKNFASSALDPWHPWPLFMLETAATALFVLVLLVGISLYQARPALVAKATAPASAMVAQPAQPIGGQPATTLTLPAPGHEERLVALLERMNARLESTTTAQPPHEFIDALEHLGQQMVQATQSMAAAQTRELQEQALNRELLLGLKDHLEKLQDIMTGPAPLPTPTPRSSIPPQPQDVIASPESANTAPTPSTAAFLSQLGTTFAQSSHKIFVNLDNASITLPANLDFERGSPLPSPKQQQVLSTIAHGLAQTLPCHVAHASATLPCRDNNPQAPRINAIRIRGQAAFAHPGEPRFYFNWKLATSRAFHALKTMLSMQPDLLALKNSRGQTLFQIEGRVNRSDEDRNRHQLDLRFFFEPTDNTMSGSTPLPSGVP
ncbi:MAG: hypothetical protein HQL79_08405 [Magnetococcales bacterium]|nr:hypothetical protein [Magnetococcales bacterium]